MNPAASDATQAGKSNPAIAATAAPPQHPTPNVPDHELLRRIGGGSYGEVWLAKNKLGTLRATKVVYRSTFEDSRPFEREFKGIQKFEPISRSHEGLVDILQVGGGEEYFYYVMELADAARDEKWNGGKGEKENQTLSPQESIVPLATVLHFSPANYQPRTLRHDVKQRARLPVAECIEIARSLASGLAHLHAHGLVHRDVKPSNIIFVNGAPKLADIGLVADVSEARSFVGTDGFIPPEGPGSPSADLYSLGKVLYEISTGLDRQAFPKLPAYLKNSPERVALSELNEIITKACDTDPRARYSNAKCMLDELVLLGDGKSVRRKRSAERAWSITKRAAAVLVLAGLLL